MGPSAELDPILAHADGLIQALAGAGTPAHVYQQAVQLRACIARLKGEMAGLELVRPVPVPPPTS